MRDRGHKLAHLQMHWGGSYDISWHEISWHGVIWCSAYRATRKDGSGSPLCAPTDGGLHQLILADYTASHPLGVGAR
jgi:hypothetical protein